MREGSLGRALLVPEEFAPCVTSVQPLRKNCHIEKAQLVENVGIRS